MLLLRDIFPFDVRDFLHYIIHFYEKWKIIYS